MGEERKEEKKKRKSRDSGPLSTSEGSLFPFLMPKLESFSRGPLCALYPVLNFRFPSVWAGDTRGKNGKNGERKIPPISRRGETDSYLMSWH